MMEALLNNLKLNRIKEVYSDWIEKAAKENMGYGDFLRGLLQEEVLFREERGIRRRLRIAGFPYEKTIEQFDFRFRPELQRQVFLTYLENTFINQGRTLCLIGPPDPVT